MATALKWLQLDKIHERRRFASARRLRDGSHLTHCVAGGLTLWEPGKPSATPPQFGSLRAGRNARLEPINRLLHGPGYFRMLVFQISDFLGIESEVEELDVFFFDDHFPIAAPHGRPELGFVSEEDVSVREVLLLEQVRLEAGPVKVFRVAFREAGDVGECREQIEPND